MSGIVHGKNACCMVCHFSVFAMTSGVIVQVLHSNLAQSPPPSLSWLRYLLIILHVRLAYYASIDNVFCLSQLACRLWVEPHAQQHMAYPLVSANSMIWNHSRWYPTTCSCAYSSLVGSAPIWTELHTRHTCQTMTRSSPWKPAQLSPWPEIRQPLAPKQTMESCLLLTASRSASKTSQISTGGSERSAEGSQTRKEYSKGAAEGN